MSQVPDERRTEAGSPGRGQQGEGHGADAEGCTQPEGEPKSGVVEDVGECELATVGLWDGQQRRDDDHVGKDGAPRGREEASLRVEIGVRQSGQAVEEDLDEEDSCERGADRSEQVSVDVFVDPL